jgi:hypothetical protein
MGAGAHDRHIAFVPGILEEGQGFRPGHCGLSNHCRRRLLSETFVNLVLPCRTANTTMETGS